MVTTPPDPLAPLLDLPGVAEAADAARSVVDRLLAHRVLRRSGPLVSAESAVRGARASAALEGAEHGLEEVRAGVDDPVVQGALRVNAELGRLAATWQRAPAQVLARLHVLAASGLAEPDRLGRPRGVAGTAARLDALARVVAGDTRVPAVVLAAVVHGELLALRPFGTGDGVVARAASRLVLITRGLDPKSVSVPEVGHVERREEYTDALAGFGRRPDGLAAWIRHCCTAVELGAREGLAVCEAILRG